MKVKCIALLNSDGRPIEHSPWLTLGKIYQVLSIFRDGNGKKRFRILTNEKDEGISSLGLHSDSCFEVVSEFRPVSWRDRTLRGGAVETSPEAWQSDGFWESLYDGDSKARIIFDRERELISGEESD